MTRRKATLFLSYFVTSFLVLSVIAIMYILLRPIDVLRDWTITADKSEYHIKDTISITTSYTKVRNISGISRRYIECYSTTGTTSRYPVNEGVANRPTTSSKATNIIFVTVPANIPNTPARCHIYISVDYQVYGFRGFTENNRTPDFNILPDGPSTPNPPSDEEPAPIQSYTEETDNAFVETSPAGINGSTRSVTVTPTAEPTPTQEPATGNPGIIQGIINTVTSLVRL